MSGPNYHPRRKNGQYALSKARKKACSRCLAPRSKHGNYCKKCHAKYENGRNKKKGPSYMKTLSLKKYNLSVEDFDRLLKKQRGRCAVCRKPPSGKGPWGHVAVLVVDHDHATNVVRGLLCNRCNLVEGLLGGDAALAKKFAAYMAKD